MISAYMEATMAKRRLSEQLADLSVRVKNAEDAVAAAEKEAHDKVIAHRIRPVLMQRQPSRK